MASKTTMFNTRFWQDAYIADLDPTEKLVFQYALTSPYLSLSGIYEVPIKYISVETGIERDMLVKIFARFEEDKKIVYKDGWLCVLNYPKYQSYNLPNVKIGLKNEIDSVPTHLLEFFKEKGFYWQGIANALASDCQLGIGIGKGTRKRNKEKEIELPEWLDKKSWADWVEHRKELRKKLTPKAIEKQLALLEANKATHKDIIEKSIRNGWTGLFEVRGSPFGASPPKVYKNKDSTFLEKVKKKVT